MTFFQSAFDRNFLFSNNAVKIISGHIQNANKMGSMWFIERDNLLLIEYVFNKSDKNTADILQGLLAISIHKSDTQLLVMKAEGIHLRFA